MNSYHIALVSRTNNAPFGEVAVVAAALQRQVTRDFAPIWNVSVTVSAFERLEDVPLGYWPILIMDDIHSSNSSGFHQDKMGQPYALVQWSRLWSIVASHECLEMLADPYGNRTITGWGLVEGSEPNKPKPGRVEFLVEVCDPCEGAPFGYFINGVLVSDFYTPNYFDTSDREGVRYDLLGHIQKPRQVLPGGYISYHDPATGRWLQQKNFSETKGNWQIPRSATRRLVPEPVPGSGPSNANVRNWIDGQTTTPQRFWLNHLSSAKGAPLQELYGDGPETQGFSIDSGMGGPAGFIDPPLAVMGDGPDHQGSVLATAPRLLSEKMYQNSILKVVADAQKQDAQHFLSAIDGRPPKPPKRKNGK
ncbi:MAG TPA: hypothetical protein VFW23_10700 [Tepidisphaeraceae bacterium]|nr:hypothetical protein [Tepidisphaeraceae bacterium]